MTFCVKNLTFIAIIAISVRKNVSVLRKSDIITATKPISWYDKIRSYVRKNKCTVTKKFNISVRKNKYPVTKKVGSIS